MSGPPRKPTRLKLIAGTDRADRVAPNEPLPEPIAPRMPAKLSDEAQREWERISEELESLGLLTRIDRAALAVYCECWADWVDASRQCASSVTAEGKTVDRKVIATAAGNLIENPYFSIKKRSAELMHKFLTEFGMTPASRTRISAVSKTADDGDDERWQGFRGK